MAAAVTRQAGARANSVLRGIELSSALVPEYGRGATSGTGRLAAIGNRQPGYGFENAGAEDWPACPRRGRVRPRHAPGGAGLDKVADRRPAMRNPRLGSGSRTPVCRKMGEVRCKQNPQ